MNKLTKLTINKFRNVVPTTLEFRPGLNVVLGKNAAGKTTLLRLLATVMGAEDDALEGDELNVCRHVSRESLGFEHTLIQERVQEPALFVKLGLHARESRSIPRRTDAIVFKRDGMAFLRIDMLPNTVLISRDGKEFRRERVFEENLAVSLVSALVYGQEAYDMSETADIFTALAQSARRMDESLEDFNRLLKIELKREPEIGLSTWNLKDFPSSMLSIMSEDLAEAGTTAEFELEFLGRVAKIIGYDSARARFDTEHLGSGTGRKSIRLSNLRFFFRRQDEEVSHELLSYGQKRLLTFFAHVDASGGTVIADELVNGLHHEWISACLEEIGDRQAFLTSQNPLLLDFLRFDSAEEVRQTFILCERVNGEAGAQLVWRNPTEEEADSFFSAYQTGIQRVSDILLTKGLW
ncbi:hypothetical protein CYFUS_009292 [Cystobacter fuscus]|uniref:ATPase AAA-type core domain-containing protein n=1 Tax=Cystobacter fuscus TaxID=43 RepID=A0A250JK10_9BACT|nr:ATP-binding protein [Cystobacter fuscus]ATB43812.1 hypothetical protein CYFUS_009292 [Cystobacter fuscus]